MHNCAIQNTGPDTPPLGAARVLRPCWPSRLKALLIAVIAVISFGLSAQLERSAETGSIKSAGPGIQFETPVFDFGRIIGGQVVSNTFVFTNIGGQLLEIKDVRSSCGCLPAGKWTRQIEPGKSGVIPLELHTASVKTGPVIKEVTVSFSDTNQSPAILQIKATVWRPIEVIPSSAALHRIADAPADGVAVVRILNKQDEPLSLSAPACNNRLISAELKTNLFGKEYQLVVKLVPPVGSGNVFADITMKTSATNMPVLTVPVWSVVQPAITVLPSPLQLPSGPIVTNLKQSVSIRSLWTNALVLSDFAINAKDVGSEIVELQPGRFFTILLTFPKGFEIAQGEKIELSLKSNHPQYPLIRVPIIHSSR
jgi:hypothetical protein